MTTLERENGPLCRARWRSCRHRRRRQFTRARLRERAVAARRVALSRARWQRRLLRRTAFRGEGVPRKTTTLLRSRRRRRSSRRRHHHPRLPLATRESPLHSGAVRPLPVVIPLVYGVRGRAGLEGRRVPSSPRTSGARPPRQEVSVALGRARCLPRPPLGTLPQVPRVTVPRLRLLPGTRHAQLAHPSPRQQRPTGDPRP